MMQATSQQFARFMAGGAVGTACHYATLVLMVEVLRAPVVVGTLTGFVVGALVNYLFSRRYVFVTTKSHRSTLPRFLMVATSGAAINTAIVAFLYGAGMHYLVAQVAATGVVLLWNFFVNKHWTFSG